MARMFDPKKLMWGIGLSQVATKGDGNYVVLNSQANASYAVAFALLKEKVEVYRTKRNLRKEDCEIPAGSFIVKNSSDVKKVIPILLDRKHLTATYLNEGADIVKAPVKFHRIGLFQSWRANMDEGWTRYMFDDMGIPYKTLHNGDIKGTKERKIDLRTDYDVIVFADESASAIKGARSGAAPAGGDDPTPRVFQSNMPPEYEGGIGQEGVDALKAFVEKGGIVVALNRAAEFAISEFGVPARNVLQNLDRTRFFCPTSILRILVDNETPIGYGMPKEAGAMFANSLAFETFAPPYDWDRKVVASFPEEGVLMSGWLLGEDVIARKAVVVDTKHKDGRIILIGIRCQNRAQSHGTYKFLLNALLYPESD
jgi:hypothetical protein